ncbi:MAG: hypothetical protein AVDCRST_MAG19-2523, partial [uncultured Thermomicrobiales bacterium]
ARYLVAADDRRRPDRVAQRSGRIETAFTPGPHHQAPRL